MSDLLPRDCAEMVSLLRTVLFARFGVKGRSCYGTKNQNRPFQMTARMKLKYLSSVIVAASLSTQVYAQVVTPVWVQRLAPFGTEGNGKNSTVLLNVDPANQLPILAGSRSEPNNNEDGSEVQPVFVRLQRYDDKRLILFVAENGINETDPALTPEQIALSNEYPDKSLVWIDAATGKSLGVAFHESAHPAQDANPPIDVQNPDTGNQLAAYDPVFTFYWRPALDEGAPGKKALYSGINHLILRYEPLPDGSGWSSTPTVAYAESIPGYGDQLTDASGGNSGDNARRWRWRNLRVYGSGTNTVIVGGGGTWRPGMHTQVLVTDDGLTFKPRGRVDDRSGGIRNDFSGGGTGSRVVKYGLDPAHPNLEVYYQGHYPAYAYKDETPERYVSDPDALYAGRDNVVAYNQQPDVAMFEPTPGITNSLSGVTNNLPPFVWQEAGKNGLPWDSSVDGIDRYDGGWSGNLEANSDLDYIVNYSFPSWNNAVPTPRYGWIGIHRLDGSISGGRGSSYQIPLTERDVPVTATVGNEALYNAWVEVTPDKTVAANLKKSEVLAAFGPLGFGLFTVQNVAASLDAQPQDQVLVAGTTNVLAIAVSGSPNTYQWKKDGVALVDGPYLKGSKTDTLTLRDVVKADAGVYTLEINNPLSGLTTTHMKISVAGAYVRPHQNIALFGVASQVSTYPGGDAFHAIDGILTQNWPTSIAHTADGETSDVLWWEVDLQKVADIGRVVYYPRSDCCADRQADITVVILDASRNELRRDDIGTSPQDPLTMDYDPSVAGRYVRIERVPANPPKDSYLNIAEVQVFNHFSPTLDVGVLDGKIVVAWDSDAFTTTKLQKASSLNGPWTDAGTETPFSEPISGTTFYRVVGQ